MAARPRSSKSNPQRSASPKGRTGAAPARKRRTPYGARQTQDKTKVFVGAGIAVVVVIFAFVMMSSGSSNVPPDDANKVPAAVPEADLVPVEKSPGFDGFGQGDGKAGKPPKTPAPEIDLADLATAQSEFEAAKLKWNESQHARTAGDHAAFKEHINAAAILMQKSRAAIEKYTDWLEEADLEGWALDASYVDLQRRLDPWDRMFQKIKKVNPNH